MKKKKDTKKDNTLEGVIVNSYPTRRTNTPLDLSKHPEYKSQQDQYYSSSTQRHS